MPKEEWGVKRVCPSCSVRFYDLRMDPIQCPSCGSSFTVESLSDSKPKALRTEKSKVDSTDDESGDLPDIGDTDEVIDGDDDIDDDLLEDDDDNVSLEDIADVGDNDDED